MLVEIKKVNKDEIAVCTSLDVAETFEKEHKHVLEDIRRIGNNISTAEFSALFCEDSYIAIKSMEMLVSGLIDCGWGYDKIKSFIQQTNTKSIAN